jgi:Flp pilus assembly protein TadG
MKAGPVPVWHGREFHMASTGLFRRFIQSQKGTVAVAYALASVPILLAAGSAIDMARYTNNISALQSALDSAALSVAAGKGSDAIRIKAGQKTLQAAIGKTELSKYSIGATFRLDGSAVVASANGQMPTAFMKLAGIKKMDLVVNTNISIPETKKAEIVLVLDYSGSMTETIGGGVKYVAMRDAAKKLLTDLEKIDRDKVKIGLVPFSHHVYGTFSKQFIRGQSGSGNWTGCTQDRPYPYNLSDSAPSGADETKWGQPQAPEHVDSGCDGYEKHNLRIIPLTNDFGGLKDALDAMTPYAWTHIALGVEFGLHVLSPNMPYTGGVAYSDAGTQKTLVLLTDGKQTEPAFGPGGIRSVSQGEKNLEQLCATAKANGIRVMTIAYDLDDNATRARLQSCATNAGKDFFIADDTSGVASAFDEIRRSVTAQIFISK